MSITGIPGSYAPAPTLRPDVQRPRGADEAAGRFEVERPAARPAEATATARAEKSLPADAPPGTDPALWSVLTAQERAFFARARSMGPVTYGPGRASKSMSAAMLGGRLDVKV